MLDLSFNVLEMHAAWLRIPHKREYPTEVQESATEVYN